MTTIQIRTEVRNIAGCMWDDMAHPGPLSKCIEAIARESDRGTDGDLTAADKARLLELSEAAREIGH